MMKFNSKENGETTVHEVTAEYVEKLLSKKACYIERITHNMAKYKFSDREITRFENANGMVIYLEQSV